MNLKLVLLLLFLSMGNYLAKTQEGYLSNKGVNFLEIGEKVNSQLIFRDIEEPTLDTFWNEYSIVCLKEAVYKKVTGNYKIQGIENTENIYFGVNDKVCIR